MKKAKVVKLTIIALCLASFTANAVISENKTESTPYEIAAKNRKLVGKYSDSIAVVRYYVKKNDIVISGILIKPDNTNIYTNNITAQNNIDLSRIKNPTVKDYQRVEKRYIPTREKILNKLEEMK